MVVGSVGDSIVRPATHAGALLGSGMGGSEPSVVTLTPIEVDACKRRRRRREQGQTPLGQEMPFKVETWHSGLPPSKTEQTPLR